jgi:hypothetical protein
VYSICTLDGAASLGFAEQFVAALDWPDNAKQTVATGNAFSSTNGPSRGSYTRGRLTSNGQVGERIKNHIDEAKTPLKQRWILLVVALFGLVVPNNMFVYASLHDSSGCGALAHNLLASSFMLDAFLAMGVLAYFFAVRPIGSVKWYWFVLMSLFGGMAFSLPLYWWLNLRRQTIP